MRIKILLAVPTLSRYDRLAKMLDTVAASTRLPDRILIVDNGGKLTREHLNSA
jgi:GT2 family glycosyltransferase